jgi:hypothetical protein
MQAITAAAPQNLISQMDFTLPSGAEFIRQRQQVTFNPSGGTTYGPGQSTIIRFHLADGEGWLDPSSVRLMFLVNNTDVVGNLLRPTSQVPSCCFSRMTIKCGGSIIEDVSAYNVVANAMQVTQSLHMQQEMGYEGFGGLQIAGLTSQRVSLKLNSGILNQMKYLPLRYISGLTIELTVAPASEWLLTPALSSQLFTITEPEIKCDLVYIAAQLADSYANHLLSAGPLPIVYSNYYVTSQAVSGTATSWSINLARACSKLQSVFIVMQGALPLVSGVATHRKTTNLTSPGNEGYSFRLQVGSKRYPLQDVKGFSESRAKLSQAVGINASSVHSLAMTAAEYRANTWIGAIDTELCALGAHLTGQDTRSGQLLTVSMDGMAPLDPSGTPATIHIILLAQTILNIRDSGVDVLD